MKYIEYQIIEDRFVNHSTFTPQFRVVNKRFIFRLKGIWLYFTNKSYFEPLFKIFDTFEAAEKEIIKDKKLRKVVIEDLRTEKQHERIIHKITK